MTCLLPLTAAVTFVASGACASLRSSHSIRAAADTGATMTGSAVCQATSCGECTGISYGNVSGVPIRCGWCHTTSQCVLGQSTGPIFPIEGCNGTNYSWGLADNATCSAGKPPPPPSGLPQAPAVDASGRTWNGNGGDNYHTYYVNESVGKVVLPQTQWVNDAHVQDGDTSSFFQGVAVGGGVVVAMMCHSAQTHLSMVTLNATTGVELGRTLLSTTSCFTVSPQPHIDATTMVGYVYSASHLHAVQLPIPGTAQEQKKLWNYTLPFNNPSDYQESCGLMLQPHLGQIHLFNAYNSNTYFARLNASNGILLAPPVNVNATGAACPGVVAYSATEILLDFYGDAIMVSVISGAVLWRDTATNANGAGGLTVSAGFLLTLAFTSSPYMDTVVNSSLVAVYPAPGGLPSWRGVMAADGEVFWWWTGGESNARGCVAEYFVANGTIRKKAGGGEESCQYNGVNYPKTNVVTRDYLFNVPGSKRPLQIYETKTGLLLNWEVKRFDAESGSDQEPGLMYHGGWLFLWTIEGIQAIAVAGVKKGVDGMP